ncbi:uncharacterized protein LOC102802929 [Saccoglossus kowalevskii]|uniref:Uncharacterized protein LOC102802929 n=1 Tax=Saccoglossus kowalevskii TaxID=10224 RepID=A0ABM0M6W8_SACKO|nr:PREDICTED: uncharacterized protein LOC102802929 [Saccoglossus kowalevskii]
MGNQLQGIAQGADESVPRKKTTTTNTQANSGIPSDTSVHNNTDVHGTRFQTAVSAADRAMPSNPVIRGNITVSGNANVQIGNNQTMNVPVRSVARETETAVTASDTHSSIPESNVNDCINVHCSAATRMPRPEVRCAQEECHDKRMQNVAEVPSLSCRQASNMTNRNYTRPHECTDQRIDEEGVNYRDHINNLI